MAITHIVFILFDCCLLKFISSLGVTLNYLQCSDTVGWVTGRAFACKKLDVGLLVVTIRLEICTSYSSSCDHYLSHPKLQ